MDLSEIKDIAILNCGDRYTYDGTNVPRATEIISKMIHEDSIVQWANSLGFKHKGYKRVLNEAAVYGTKAHSTIEKFLEGEELPENYPTTILDGFKQWWDILNSNNTVEVIGQEQKLSCQWFGGTYDMLISINGRLHLVDFKTSNHVTYKYYLQLAAYNYLLKQQGVNIQGVIILQLRKDSPAFNEYVLNLDIPEQKQYFDLCERTFLSLVYGYYHIYWLEAKFNEFFKRKR